MLRRLADWIIRAPWLFIAVALAFSLALGSGARLIRINDDLTTIVPDNNPVKQAALELEKLFGASETIVLMIKTQGGSIFEPAFLAELAALKERLENARHVARVLGLATLDRYYRDQDGALQSAPLLALAPDDVSAAAAIAAFVNADADIQRAFVSPDGKATAVYVDPKGKPVDRELLAVLNDALAPTRAKYAVYWTGMPVIRDATARSIRSDLLVLMPTVVLVLIAILAFSLGTASGVTLTFFVIVLSILPAAGLMGYLGLPLTAVNNTFPVLILATGCGYAVHIITGYYHRLRAGREKREAIVRALRELGAPVFLSALTTTAGFISLMTSPLPPIGILGLVVATGVVAAWALAMLALPALLSLFSPPRRMASNAPLGWLERGLELIWSAPLKQPAALAAVIVLTLAGLIGYGIPRVVRETRVERFFFENEPARVDAEAIDAAFRGSTPLEIVVKHNVNDPLAQQKALDFAAAAQQLPYVGSVDSIANVVARMQEAFVGRRGIPDSEDQVAQALFMYSLSVPPERYRRFVESEGKAFRITVRVPNLAPAELDLAVSELQALAAKHLSGLEIKITGKALFLRELSDLMVQGSINSILSSVALVFLMVALSFRSLREGLESAVPIAVAVVGVFGIMGVFGLPLTIATTLVTSIVIGTGVDFAVHMQSSWNVLRDEKDLRWRLSHALHDCGYRILVNAFGVGCGLGVLAFSHFEPIRQLGMLAVVSMLGAALGALWIIPLLKMVGRSKTA